MKHDTNTKVAYRPAPGEDTRITSETAFNDKLKKATDAKETLPELIASGTFDFSYAESVEEAVTLAGGTVTTAGTYENTDVFLGVFNYAAALRQNNEANDILTDSGFTAWEGARDVSYAVAQKVERAKMSAEEKAINLLKKAGFDISPEQLRAALASIQANREASATATA